MADGKAKELESKIKSHFKSDSVTNINGNNSEWFRVPLNTLYSFIFSFLSNPISSEDEKSYEQYQELDGKDLSVEKLGPSISAKLEDGQTLNVGISA